MRHRPATLTPRELKDEMRNTLLSVGVTQPDANLAAGRVGDLQITVTLRKRRWYERY
jgi:hypothetical protein